MRDRVRARIDLIHRNSAFASLQRAAAGNDQGDHHRDHQNRQDKMRKPHQPDLLTCPDNPRHPFDLAHGDVTVWMFGIERDQRDRLDRLALEHLGHHLA